MIESRQLSCYHGIQLSHFVWAAILKCFDLHFYDQRCNSLSILEAQVSHTVPLERLWSSDQLYLFSWIQSIFTTYYETLWLPYQWKLKITCSIITCSMNSSKPHWETMILLLHFEPQMSHSWWGRFHQWQNPFCRSRDSYVGPSFGDRN